MNIMTNAPQHKRPNIQTFTLMRNSLHALIFLSLFSFLVSSCVTVKHAIYDIPKEDLTTSIYYRDAILPEDGGSYSSRKCSEALSTSLFTTTSNFSAPLFEKATSLEPSLSPDGTFIIMENNEPPDNNSGNRGEHYFYVLNITTGEKVFETKTQLPCNGYSLVVPALQWSIFDNYFFYSSSDTIYKCYPNGKQMRLAVVEGVQRFSLSPSEEWLLFVLDDGIGLVKLTTQESFVIREFDELLGINLDECVDIVSWSLDGTMVSFSEGKRIFIYTISSGKRAIYKSTGTIHALEWVPNNQLVFVEGNGHVKQAIFQEDSYFKIFLLDPFTMKEQLLHEGRDQSPEYVKPKLSPSQTLLLFSEKDIQRTSVVRLLTLDGQAITTVCNGHSPMWAK